MHGHALTLFALLLFSGLLWPGARSVSALWDRGSDRVPRESSPSDASEQAILSSLSLNAIELALISELSLEQARAYDEVAEDPTHLPETRRAASATAAAWRERARMLQLAARRRSAYPMLPQAGPLHVSRWTYTGPERRRRMRRTATRRSRPVTAVDGVGGGERRVGRDRREADRRYPEPSSP
jgi:hypothetical protein